MNRTLAQFIGWLSLIVGGALVAMVVLVPPWLELHYAQWEKEWMAACARSQQEQVEAYEHFASALSSNDPVLLQRLAHHHLRLKPSQWDLVSLPEDEMAISFHDTPGDSRAAAAVNSKAPLVEQWLHKAYPVVGVDHPAYEAPDHLTIRLSTGPRRLILLALGGLFLLCGLVMPGPVPPATADTQKDDDGSDDDDGEFVHAVIDDEADEQDMTRLHRAA